MHTFPLNYSACFSFAKSKTKAVLFKNGLQKRLLPKWPRTAAFVVPLPRVCAQSFNPLASFGRVYWPCFAISRVADGVFTGRTLAQCPSKPAHACAMGFVCRGLDTSADFTPVDAKAQERKQAR